MEEIYLFLKYIMAVLATIIAPILLLAGLLLLGDALNGKSCQSKATMQNLEYNYSFTTGCMIKTEKGWMDYTKFIYTQEIK